MLSAGANNNSVLPPMAAHLHLPSLFFTGLPLKSQPILPSPLQSPPTPPVTPLVPLSSAAARAAPQQRGPSTGGVETYLIERIPDGSKPCCGAIPLCILDNFEKGKGMAEHVVVVVAIKVNTW